MKKHLKLYISLIITAVLLSLITALLMYDRFVAGRTELETTVEEAQVILDDTIKSLPLNVSKPVTYVAENTTVTVKSLEYGNEKDVILNCEFETVDILSLYKENRESIFSDVYGYYLDRTNAGKMCSATNIRTQMNSVILGLLQNADTITGDLQIKMYDTGKGSLILWLDDETVNTFFGGILTVRDDIKATESVVYNGENVDISSNNTLRNGVEACFGLSNYSSVKPDTSTLLKKIWNSFANEFYRNFIEDNKWTYLTNGLLNTLSITGLSLIIGIIVGFFTALVRFTHDKAGKLPILNAIGRLYVNVIRGTPVMVQLLIIYFVILLPIGIEKFPAAVLCFGLNSGAYVSEIIRGGIMSVDGGQMEAGRSLGFSFSSTMFLIVMPQAFKSVLPALCNEFIALLKETSVAFYIGVADLMQGGIQIRSITYSNFMPLIAVAFIYLVLVLVLTKLVGILERRLRRSDR